MTDAGEDHDETADLGPWERSVGEMRTMAEDLRAAGWQVVDVVAGHTTPEPPSAGSSDRFGLVYTVSGDDAPAFTDAFEAGSFDETAVFRRRVDGDLFVVTRMTDTDGEVAILVAGAVEYRQMAENLVDPARAEGSMYTHVQTLDWTHLGSFRHEDFELFFEDAE